MESKTYISGIPEQELRERIAAGERGSWAHEVVEGLLNMLDSARMRIVQIEHENDCMVLNCESERAAKKAAESRMKALAAGLKEAIAALSDLPTVRSDLHPVLTDRLRSLLAANK